MIKLYRMLAWFRGRLWCFGSTGGVTSYYRKIDGNLWQKEVQWDKLGRTTFVRKAKECQQ